MKKRRSQKPLPLGEVALRSNDGEGKPVTTEPLHRDRQALCQSDAFAAFVLFSSSLALSGASRQLPQRGSHWQAGPLSAGRLRPDSAQKSGPRLRGQQLLDKSTLSSCCESL